MLKLTLFFALLFLMYFPKIYAQGDTLYSLAPEDVLASPPPKIEEVVSVASFQQTSIRNSPSVVTVITAEEIQRLGARELTDVLRMVAGLDFAQNFDMVMGLGVRGNWAEEGKFLFLLDGQTVNESGFGTLMFYMRVPLDNVERIEVLRGAGSAIYGGLAALCVINVVTKHKRSNKDLLFSSQIGVGRQGLTRNQVQLQLTQQIYAETSISLSTYIGTANMSNSLQRTPVGTLVDYRDSSSVKSRNFHASLYHKSWQMSAIWNKYEFTAIPEVTTPNPAELVGTMQDFLISVSKPTKISEKWVLLPRLQWKTQQPWWYEGYQNLAGRLTFDRYKTINQRFTIGTVARFEANNWLNVSMGGEFFRDYARYALPRFTFYNGKNNIEFTNIAFFTEAVITSNIANITIGARSDKNSAYQWAFAPRIALNKVWRNWHTKALLNYAFKAPTIQNIQYGFSRGIRPEWIRAIEIEAGYTFKDKFFITTNFFDIHIDGPIVYVFEPATLSEYYNNKNNAGTRGIEMEAKWKSPKFHFKANHSYYQNQRTDVSDYLVEGKPSLLAGFPQHKTTFNASCVLSEKWNVGLNGLYFSEKYAYSYFGEGFTDFRLNSFPATYSVNMTVNYKLPWHAWEANLSVFNLTNQTIWLVSPVSSGVTPFPQQGRELVFKIAYGIE